MYVLILVLVEHTLGDVDAELSGEPYPRLNPCFSGTYSRRLCLTVTMCFVILS